MRNHQLSQHFLRSPKLALILIGHSNIKKRDLVLDIGAGSGVITCALAKRAREVWAIEPDPATATKLRANLARQGIENVRVIEQDFREIELPSEPYKVFSNPPFHLSAEILYKLLGLRNVDGVIVRAGDVLEGGPPKNHKDFLGEESAAGPARLPDAIYLILQKNLALKLIPTDRHYTSQLGHFITKNYAAKIRYPLKKTDFTPPPAVDTVLWEAKLIPGNLQSGGEESL